MGLLASYVNGNAKVQLYSNGTRIVETIDPNATKFKYDFPLNFDICISKNCAYNCAYCHEGATIDGKYGDILNLSFIDSIVAGTEMAIGGGDALHHPDIEPFLIKLKEKGIIANITVNQKQIVRDYELLKRFIDEKLIYGVGVSLTNSKDTESLKLIDTLGPNVVIHVIAGIFNKDDIDAVINKKILVLGYKDFRRGIDYKDSHNTEIIDNINWLKENLKYLESKCKLVSMDCLAIKQLDPKVNLKISDKVWDIIFQRDDYSDEASTMYIDAVNMQIARSSTYNIEKRISFTGNEDIRELYRKSMELA